MSNLPLYLKQTANTGDAIEAKGFYLNNR